MSNWKLPPLQSQVLDLIVEAGGAATARELAEQHQLKTHSVSGALTNLYSRGILRREPASKETNAGYRFFLVENWESKALSHNRCRETKPDYRVTKVMHDLFLQIERGVQTAPALKALLDIEECVFDSSLNELIESGYVEVNMELDQPTYRVTDKVMIYDNTDAELQALFHKMATKNQFYFVPKALPVTPVKRL